MQRILRPSLGLLLGLNNSSLISKASELDIVGWLDISLVEQLWINFCRFSASDRGLCTKLYSFTNLSDRRKGVLSPSVHVSCKQIMSGHWVLIFLLNRLPNSSILPWILSDQILRLSLPEATLCGLEKSGGMIGVVMPE